MARTIFLSRRRAHAGPWLSRPLGRGASMAQANEPMNGFIGSLV